MKTVKDLLFTKCSSLTVWGDSERRWAIDMMYLRSWGFANLPDDMVVHVCA